MPPYTQMTRFISARLAVPSTHYSEARHQLIFLRQYGSDAANNLPHSQPNQQKESQDKSSDAQQPKKKTQAELDLELQLKMQGLAGDGGESGIEYEDGQPTAMKRSVRNNMFRYI